MPQSHFWKIHINIILLSTPEIFFPSLWNLVKTEITTTTTTATTTTTTTTTTVDAARFLF